MGKHKHGFTIIEVTLFVGITALLFLTVTIGVHNSIYQQRYNDAVEGFADYLRNVYSYVLNVQSTGNGRSGEAIYGRLVTFGESAKPAGSSLDAGQIIYDYTVIGHAVSAAKLQNKPAKYLLAGLDIKVARDEGDEFNSKYQTVGIINEYVPRWGARVQTISGSFTDFKGSLLVVRNPKSGVVQTLYYSEPIQVNQTLNSQSSNILTLLSSKLSSFESGEVDFCINPNGTVGSDHRTNIRIAYDAMNASGVEILPLDSEENKCNGS